jgi:hypothetical protein
MIVVAATLLRVLLTIVVVAVLFGIVAVTGDEDDNGYS